MNARENLICSHVRNSDGNFDTTMELKEPKKLKRSSFCRLFHHKLIKDPGFSLRMLPFFGPTTNLEDQAESMQDPIAFVRCTCRYFLFAPEAWSFCNLFMYPPYIERLTDMNSSIDTITSIWQLWSINFNVSPAPHIAPEPHSFKADERNGSLIRSVHSDPLHLRLKVFLEDGKKKVRGKSLRSRTRYLPLPRRLLVSRGLYLYFLFLLRILNLFLSLCARAWEDWPWPQDDERLNAVSRHALKNLAHESAV
jgi:hypothetical protein